MGVRAQDGPRLHDRSFPGAQDYPAEPGGAEQTTNCTSSAVSFAVRENEVEALVQYFVDSV